MSIILLPHLARVQQEQRLVRLCEQMGGIRQESEAISLPSKAADAIQDFSSLSRRTGTGHLLRSGMQ
jgi:hypothetical protein